MAGKPLKDDIVKFAQKINMYPIGPEYVMVPPGRLSVNGAVAIEILAAITLNMGLAFDEVMYKSLSDNAKQFLKEKDA